MKAKHYLMLAIMLLILICSYIYKKISKESFSLSSRGMIAFSNTPANDNNEIYLINADGSGLQRLTNHQGRDCAPAWSPDAAKIAFYVHYDNLNTWSIHVMDADGSNIQRLTEKIGVRDHSPSWSPDGKQIVFSRGTSDSAEIWRMNADGSNLRKYDSVIGGGPEWSPDGTRITFHSNRDGNSEIYVMNADDSNQRRLTNNNADEWWPSWSPDGSQIVLQSNRDGNYEIYKMNSDGTNQTRLTNNPAEDAEPDWSPDGEKIAFSSFRDGKFEIYVMNSDGSNQTRLTNLSEHNIQPDWRPISIDTTDVDNGNSLDSSPKSFELFQTYPNRFNVITTKRYAKQPSIVSIRIIRIKG